MLIDEIRRTPAKVLTEEQREAYWRNGYLLLERLVPEEWLGRLRAATDGDGRAQPHAHRVGPGLRPRARSHRRRTTVAPGHEGPVDQHPGLLGLRPWSRLLADGSRPTSWDRTSRSTTSKLNFKWARGGAEVKWHQDIQYWPHTNYTPLTFGTYLYDCGMEQGPLGVLPGSHERPLYDLYGDDGAWAGALSDRDAAGLDTERTVYLPGPAGSVTIHNCRTAHHSAANDSPIGRPLLLNVYKAADALPYAEALPRRPPKAAVRREPGALGPPPTPRPCLMPPDWSR